MGTDGERGVGAAGGGVDSVLDADFTGFQDLTVVGTSDTDEDWIDDVGSDGQTEVTGGWDYGEPVGQQQPDFVAQEVTEPPGTVASLIPCHPVDIVFIAKGKQGEAWWWDGFHKKKDGSRATWKNPYALGPNELSYDDPDSGASLVHKAYRLEIVVIYTGPWVECRASTSVDLTMTLCDKSGKVIMNPETGKPALTDSKKGPDARWIPPIGDTRMVPTEVWDKTKKTWVNAAGNPGIYQDGITFTPGGKVSQGQWH